MEDTIEICAGCGKMPRAIDRETGSFVCSRCGNRTVMQVTADDYEKVASELDRKFHEAILMQRAAAVSKEPIKPAKPKKSAAKKAPAKKAPKKAAKPSSKKRR
jgi:DNA-directed RNA polymerase subunit RPC12/RpoP